MNLIHNVLHINVNNKKIYYFKTAKVCWKKVLNNQILRMNLIIVFQADI